MELDDENLKYIVQIMNQWWQDEKVPQQLLQARVVSLYKKGDTSKMENYRPISLLNSMYKIYAAIIQERLQKGLDKHLQKNTIRL